MGTRSGSIDPAIIPFLEEKEHLSPKELETLLNKKSGILGISEISSDVRDIYRFFLEGDSRARLTLEMISYQVTSFIGALAAVMGGVQVISFTGGIGENAFYIRKMALEPLRFLGVHLDEKKNMLNSKEISAPSSRVKVYVIPTDEERQIYREGVPLLDLL
jgi:acetate kinase